MKGIRAEIIKFAVLLAVALGAAPAFSSMWQWSQTASSNATADPTINWAEGMSPSSVNDSARAMMAVLAKWRDDTSGLLLTTGTSSAYLVTTNAGNTAATPPTGYMITVRPNATNAAGATIRVDSGTAFPINTATGTAIGAGVMVSGTPYSMMFTGTVWLLREFRGEPYAVPLGGYIDTSISTAPNSNFVAADSGCISRTTYAAYFAAVGTTYGACDGTTTFGVPDQRGRTRAMFDGGVGRMTLAVCGNTFNTAGNVCGSDAVTLSQGNIPSYSLSSSGLSVSGTITNGSDIRYWNGFVNVTASGSTPVDAFQTSTYSPSWSGSISGSINSGGSGTALGIVQPTLGVYTYIRVL